MGTRAARCHSAAPPGLQSSTAATSALSASELKNWAAMMVKNLFHARAREGEIVFVLRNALARKRSITTAVAGYSTVAGKISPCLAPFEA